MSDPTRHDGHERPVGMSAEELEQLLGSLAVETHAPSDALRAGTQRRLTGMRLLGVSLFASLALLLSGTFVVSLALLSSAVAPGIKILLAGTCLLGWGTSLILLTAARHTVARFLMQLDHWPPPAVRGDLR